MSGSRRRCGLRLNVRGTQLRDNLHKRRGPVYSFRPTRLRQQPLTVEDARLTTTTIRPVPKRGHWLFSVNPHQYHWDTLLVKGKEMWHEIPPRATSSSPGRPRTLLPRRTG